MKYLDPPQPQEMDWSDGGVTWRDTERRRVQGSNGLRDAVRNATLPKLEPQRLARLAGVDVRVIYNFRNGSHTPSQEILVAIQDALLQELESDGIRSGNDTRSER